MPELQVEQIVFPNGNEALCVRAPEAADAQSIIAVLELPKPRALLIINGGTAKLDARVSQNLSKLFEAVAQTVIENSITVMTGATDAGIFALFGRALQRAGRLKAPCIGVSAGMRLGLEALEPHHSHFVLIETETWSKATPFMYEMAATLARDCPSLALFAGGGPTTLSEMRENVRQHREMILLAGSQGVTDALVAARRVAPVADEEVKSISREGRLTIFDLEDSPAALTKLMTNRLLRV
ncbi:MAG TPA: hypothetical protein VGC91_03160 [Pyrinomonadaceae bacterium]|jgi:hypothetical protein